jgi:hypothetical protein
MRRGPTQRDTTARGDMSLQATGNTGHLGCTTTGLRTCVQDLFIGTCGRVHGVKPCRTWSSTKCQCMMLNLL